MQIAGPAFASTPAAPSARRTRCRGWGRGQYAAPASVETAEQMIIAANNGQYENKAVGRGRGCGMALRRSLTADWSALNRGGTSLSNGYRRNEATHDTNRLSDKMGNMRVMELCADVPRITRPEEETLSSEQFNYFKINVQRINAQNVGLAAKCHFTLSSGKHFQAHWTSIPLRVSSSFGLRKNTPNLIFAPSKLQRNSHGSNVL